jgi:hypothetical protein
VSGRRYFNRECCQSATVSILFFSPDSVQRKDFTVVRKISLALVLMAMTGVASASGGRSDNCVQILWWSFCSPSYSPTPVQAPEIDPASAMAGLTMLAGGLAVLRGRRKQKS